MPAVFTWAPPCLAADLLSAPLGASSPKAPITVCPFEPAGIFGPQAAHVKDRRTVNWPHRPPTLSCPLGSVFDNRRDPAHANAAQTPLVRSLFFPTVTAGDNGPSANRQKSQSESMRRLVLPGVLACRCQLGCGSSASTAADVSGRGHLQHFDQPLGATVFRYRWSPVKANCATYEMSCGG